MGILFLKAIGELVWPVEYLPPGSPGFSPIENLWSKLTQMHRSDLPSKKRSQR
jgi:transposase